MLKTILNYHDRLDRVLTLTKTKYENYASDRIDVVYTENEIDLLWLIRPNMVYH